MVPDSPPDDQRCFEIPIFEGFFPSIYDFRNLAIFSISDFRIFEKIRIFGAKMEDFWLIGHHKFKKFSPAAQIKEDLWLKDPPKFSKFSPAAQK